MGKGARTFMSMAGASAREFVGRTLAVREVGELVVVVHRENFPPSDADWEGYVAWCKALLRERGTLKVLVFTNQHGPSARQRSVYNKEIASDAVRVAVLMAGRHLVAIVKVFSWFIKINAFEKHDLAGALKYLDVEPSSAITETVAEFAGASKAAVG